MLTAIGLLILAELSAEVPVNSKIPFVHVPVAESRLEIPDSDSAFTVLIFVNIDCPIANTYAREIERIRADYEAVTFYRVYADFTLDASDIRAHASEFDYGGSALLDSNAYLAYVTGVRTTPEAVVLDRQGHIRYRGRIDDRYVELGVYKTEAEEKNLRLALDALLDGELPSIQQTDAVGCTIQFLEEHVTEPDVILVRPAAKEKEEKESSE